MRRPSSSSSRWTGENACDGTEPHHHDHHHGTGDHHVHGGLLATALDSAMVHALFARGIVARTAELKVRYRHPVGVGEGLDVRAWLRKSFGPLHELEAEIRCGGATCAHARAKFMADQPAESSSAQVKSPVTALAD